MKLSVQEQYQLSLDTFEAIEKTTSRTEKEELLKRGLGIEEKVSVTDLYKVPHNEVLVEMLEFTFDTSYVFYINKIKPYYATDKKDDVENFNKFKILLLELSSRAITGNRAYEKTKKLLEQCNPRESYWFMAILKKDLKIGISEKTVNKVCKGLIREFSAMLAKPFDKYPTSFVVQPKLDGYRCLAFNYSDNVVLRTRNGKHIQGFEELERQIAKLPTGFVYDGEIMAGDFNGTQKEVFKKKGNKDGVYHLFDCVSIEEFNTKGRTTYENRLRYIENELKPFVQLELDKVVVVETSKKFSCTDEDLDEQVINLHKEYVEQGYEGTMVKDLAVGYVTKRTSALQKIKDMETLDLVVIDVLEGGEDTKYKGTLGSLVVDYKGYPVRVGSGYDDIQRKEFWNNKTSMINKVIEVKFQEETKDMNGNLSLRFPIFLKIREDK